MFDPLTNITIGVLDGLNSSSFFQRKWDAFLDVVGKYGFYHLEGIENLLQVCLATIRSNSER